MADSSANTNPPIPPAPQNFPGAPAAPSQPSAAAGSSAAGNNSAGNSGAAPSTGTSVSTGPTAQAALASPGCFRLDIRLNTIQFDYDPTATGQITQDQLDLLGQIRKTESALKAIFFPEGLPSDLRLRKPAGPSVRSHHHATHSGGTATSVTANHAAKAQHQEEENQDEIAGKQADSDRGKKDVEKKKAKFRSYYYALFLLGQIGLDGPKAQPSLARVSLASLKDQILTLEGGRIKNGYMQALGIWAGYLGVGPLVLLVAREVARLAPSGSFLDKQYLWPLAAVFLYGWVGAMVGTFLSFAMRNPVLSFDQLAAPEEDRMNPRMRLVYVGLLTLVFTAGLVFHAFTIAIGSVSTASLLNLPSLAFLIGVFCGISERALGERILKSADSVGK